MGADTAFLQLVEIMNTLRGPNGCPWDREQTPQSLRPYCIEEAFEVVEALDEGDPAKLRDELGDLLLQVVFHAQFGSEAGTFTITDVIQALNEKLVRRHPHVFRRQEGDAVNGAGEVLERWAEIKKKEGRKNLLDGVPKALPSLLRATRVGEKAASVGFDWPDIEGVWKKVEEELVEFRSVEEDPQRAEEEFGDLLFALANLSRHRGIDAESALRTATAKFEKRFRWVEAAARKNGQELSNLSLDQLETLWVEAKKQP